MLLKQTFHKLNKLWLAYEYKHTTLAIAFMLAFIIFLNSAAMIATIDFAKNLTYVGVFLVGILSVSFFTALPAFVLLVQFAQQFDPVALAIVAGAGAMIGDWLLLQFFEERVFRELKPVFSKLHVDALFKKLQRRSMAWILLLVGVVVLTTPVPDEIGIALLGISHVKKPVLLIICFALNTLGMLTIVLTARAIVG